MRKNKLFSELNLFYFILVDILFLPYIRGLPIRPFMIVLLFWLFKGGFNKIFDNRKMFSFILFITLSVLSILIGVLCYSSDIFPTTLVYSNLQPLVIIIFGFLLLYFFKYINIKYSPNINKILVSHIVFAFAFSLLYWVNSEMFWNVRSFWTISGDNIVFDSVLTERFTHIFSEPNNFAVVSTVVLSYLISQNNIKFKSILFLLSSFVIFTSLSVTGLIVYVYSMIILLIFKLTNKSRSFTISINSKKVFAMVVGTIIVIVVYFVFLSNFVDNVAYNLVRRAKYYFDNDNFSGSRFGIWKKYIESSKLYYNIIIGKAGSVINGSIGKPHNGHLFLISHFGLIAYIIFVFHFFKKQIYHSLFAYLLIVIPFFLIFTFNTLVQDLRSFYLFVIIISFSVLEVKKCKRKEWKR